ncbi:MAG: hypothetical protein WAM73_21130 [Desulfobacterales bacterium]
MVDPKENSPERAAAASIGKRPRAGHDPGPPAPMCAAAAAAATDA